PFRGVQYPQPCEPGRAERLVRKRHRNIVGRIHHSDGGSEQRQFREDFVLGRPAHYAGRVEVCVLEEIGARTAPAQSKPRISIPFTVMSVAKTPIAASSQKIISRPIRQSMCQMLSKISRTYCKKNVKVTDVSVLFYQWSRESF